jgi:hypothetical protein
MRRLGWVLVPLLALALPCTARAGIAIRESKGKVDVAVAAAPLADVLDRLARQTGMKIVYEGPAPRQLVTVSLLGRSPAEAVTALLEGQGLNYALVLDATATRVEQLLVAGPAALASSTPARRTPPSPLRPRYVPPEPQVEADPFAEEDVPPPDPATPPAPEISPAPSNPVPPATAPPAPPMPTPPPAPLFPSSPFNPVPVFPAPPPPPQPAPETPPTEAPPQQ